MWQFNKDFLKKNLGNIRIGGNKSEEQKETTGNIYKYYITRDEVYL